MNKLYDGLTDGIVSLRPLRAGDRERLKYLADNEKISRNLRDRFPNPYTIADADSFIELSVCKDPNETFAIIFEDEYVGNIGLQLGEDVYRMSGELGYFLGEEYWNRGIMSRAVRIICDYGFTRLGLVRIWSGVFSFNAPSARVLEKCGFTREAILRRAVIKNGEICDEWRYARVIEGG